LIFFALYANLRDEIVSFINCYDEEQFTIIEVKKLPVKESFSNLVSFESLNGIWSVLFLVVKALITLPKQESE
jgi:hypothetical protein